VAFENFGQVWQRASLMQRVLLLGVTLGCVGSGVFLVNWARQPNMALLYGGLSPEDAAAMVEKIRDASVAYELKQGGTAVYVPEEKVYSLRLTLASAGLPTGENRGYQILEESRLGESPFAERMKALIAREQEIARSIQTLDAVAAARVHLVRPEAALFRKADESASATVVVKLKGGRTLTPSNVAAISHMVAGAVEGLDAQKVVIVDAQGNLFSGDSDDGVHSRMASVLEQKRQVEEYLARKAERHLEAVLGPNRATVQVAVELNTTTTESEKKTYGPDKGLTSREMIKESRTTEPASTKDGTGGTTTDTTTETEMMVSEVVQRTVEMAGQIRSKTVSVIVDLTAPVKEGETAAATKIMAVTDVEEIVKNALGLRPAAATGGTGGTGAAAGEEGGSDSLTVKEAAFYKPPEVAGLATEPEGMFSKDFLLEVARRSSLGLLVLGALLALRMFRPKHRPLSEAEAAALPGLGGGGGLLTAGAGEGNPEVLKAQITRALQDNPDEVKRLFLSWIESEKGGT